MNRPQMMAMLRQKAVSVRDMLRHPRHALGAAQRRVAMQFLPLTLPWLPTHLDVEPANDCNLKCDHCQVTHWNKDRVHMDLLHFKKLLEQFPVLSSLKLQGMGEPMLNKNLSAMLMLGEAYGIRMRFVTNGTVMTDKLLDEIASLRNTQVQVSVDGSSKSVFELVRKGAKFEKVVETIRALVERRKRDGRGPTVSLAMVLTSRNLAEASGVVKLASDLGVDWMVLQTFLSDWGKDDMRARNEPVRVEHDSKSMRDTIDESVTLAEKEGVALHVSYGDHLSKDNPCTWPWTGAYIASNGDVVPCCIIADADVAKMGNVFEQNIAEIWNNDAYRTLRQQIRDGEPPAYCQNCYKH